MILNDREIEELARAGMIEPFVPEKTRVNRNGEKAISFGLSSMGYDIRVANKFKVFDHHLAKYATTGQAVIVDPKNIADDAFVDVEGEFVIIPPNSFALAHSVECFNIPTDILAVVLGKSTYARCGIICNVTPLEPGWRGHVTLEISNTTPLPAKIYANEGLCQVLFHRASEPCRTPYADGKYQNQGAEITLPR